jgi:hypothetical protein
MRVTGIRLRPVADGSELSADISGLPGRRNTFRLWFRLPAGYLAHASAEPFLAALLPIGIVSGEPLEIDAPVSGELLRNIRQFEAIWRRWEPSFRGCRVSTAGAYAPPAPGHGTGCFFTGGVDSFYTLHRLIHRAAPLSHLIFVRGFAEMPLDNDALYRQAQSHLGEVAAALGLTLVCASTNLREILTYSHVDWDLYAGSSLAAIGHCLAARLQQIYIPSGDTYATLSPWGSHPLTDPLWGTERLEFVHHGCEASRSEKVEHAVAAWPLALAHIRVCGSGLESRYNCGYCEKCLRSAVALKACGVLDACPLLPALDCRRVAALDSSSRVTRYYLRDNLELVQRRGPHPELEAALRQALSPSFARRARMRTVAAFRKLDQQWLGGAARRLALAAAGNAESEADLKADPGRWLARRLRGG